MKYTREQAAQLAMTLFHTVAIYGGRTAVMPTQPFPLLPDQDKAKMLAFVDFFDGKLSFDNNDADGASQVLGVEFGDLAPAELVGLHAAGAAMVAAQSNKFIDDAPAPSSVDADAVQPTNEQGSPAVTSEAPAEPQPGSPGYAGHAGIAGTGGAQ